MKAPKKDATQKTTDFLKEPATENVKPISEASETEEEMHPILVQLLEKALEQSEQELGRPHEEVWAEMKQSIILNKDVQNLLEILSRNYIFTRNDFYFK